MLMNTGAPSPVVLRLAKTLLCPAAMVIVPVGLATLSWSEPVTLAFPSGLIEPLAVKVTGEPAAFPERYVPLAVPDKLTRAFVTGLVATRAAAAWRPAAATPDNSTIDSN